MKSKKGNAQIAAIALVFILLAIAFNGVKTNANNMDMLETQVLNSDPSYDSPILLIKVTNLLVDDVDFEIGIEYDEGKISTDNYYIERGKNIKMSDMKRREIETYSISLKPLEDDFWNHPQSVKVNLIYKNKVLQSEKVYLNKISFLQKVENLL